MEYVESLRYLYSFADWERGIGYGVGAPPRFTLDRITSLLRVLDNPHQRFPSVHIAGSKGKGSTAATVESILRAAGMRTGLYTQPHLHTFRERVRINNGPVAIETFTRLVERVAAAAGILQSEQPHLGQPTTYELATCLGFLCFAEAAVEMAVVEVGLGGRLDATNVLEPCVSVITSISLEHTAILGSTLSAIAREKAGIVKEDGLLVHAPNPQDVEAVFQEVCAERRARIIAADTDQCELLAADMHSDSAAVAGAYVTGNLVAVPTESGAANPPTSERLVHHNSQEVPSDRLQTSSCAQPAQMCRIRALGEERTVRFPLLGRHQRLNLSVALAVIDELAAQGIPLSNDEVCRGVESVVWPGRFEQLSASPFIIADGAHTPDAMVCLRETLAEHFPGRSISCVLGVNRDKDLGPLLDALLPSIDGLIVTKSRHPRAQDPQEVAAVAAGRVPTVVAASVAQAISCGLDRMASEGILCATGSLFVAAEAREALGLAASVDPPLETPGNLA